MLALATMFLAWVSAEPFWLAIGHGHTGTATISSTSRGCRAAFVADDRSFTVSTVEVAGLRDCPDGSVAPAGRSPTPAGLVARSDFVRPGRLTGWRGTTMALLSLGAPALVTVAMLALAY